MTLRSLTVPARALTALAVALLIALSAAGTALAATGTPQTEVQISPVDLTQEDTIQAVTVTVTNASRSAMTRTEVSLRGPAGWSVSPQSSEIRRLEAGERAHVVFDVRVPTLRDGFRSYPFTASLSYRGGDGIGSATQQRILTAGETAGSVAEARDNVGVTTLDTLEHGRFDGEGNSFSAEALAEVGVTPGATLRGAGAEFTWPDVAGDEADNVAASGHAIELDGSGSALAFLASGSSMAATGEVTVHYTDGSTSTGTLGVPNWTGDGANPGAEVVAASTGRNTPAGYGNQTGTYSVFATSIPLVADKQVDVVVLPADPTIHVFDIAVSS